MSKLRSDKHIEEKLNLDEMDLTLIESKTIYEEIKEHVFQCTKPKVSSLYILQMPSGHEVFMELFFRAYRGEGKEQRELEENEIRYLTVIYSLLSAWKIEPDTKEDSSLDAELMSEWIRRVLEIASETGRTRAVQSYIGRKNVLRCLRK